MTGIEEERRGGVLELRLDRPEQLNAFNDAMYNAAADALARAAADDGVACVLLTGKGRAFSAGQDLGELADERDHETRMNAGFRPFIEAVESFPKPLIAAVNGIGVGIGLTLLPHCDIVLMAESARLRAPFVNLGVTAEAGSSLLLPQRLGWNRAAEMLFTGGWLNASEAVECGLALRAVPDDALLTEARDLAVSIARMPVASLTATKRLMLDARLSDVRAARGREERVFSTLIGGPANREAIAAFEEGREPDFNRGR